MVRECRDAFKEYLKNDLIRVGGAVTIDGVSLKAQGRQFLDLAVHHFHMKKTKALLERLLTMISLGCEKSMKECSRDCMFGS